MENYREEKYSSVCAKCVCCTQCKTLKCKGLLDFSNYDCPESEFNKLRDTARRRA